ncbi:MAG: hypothetical protein GY724_01335 [Actinomycetia bacterium]|nr:hypothetical protein [Actinomycetes bacterium]
MTLWLLLATNMIPSVVLFDGLDWTAETVLAILLPATITMLGALASTWGSRRLTAEVPTR